MSSLPIILIIFINKCEMSEPRSYRVLSFDCGNVHTGITVADIVPNETFKIVSLLLFVENKTGANTYDRDLIEFCKHNVDPFVVEVHTSNVLVVYENVWNPNGMYRNWNLIGLQKRLRKHYENDVGVRVRSLLSSQKWKLGGSGKSSTRKHKSVEYCMELLEDVDDSIRNAFNSIQRQHDISDSVLAARYMMDHPQIFDVGTRTKTTRDKNTKKRSASKSKTSNHKKRSRSDDIQNDDVIDLT